jgi:hypothetical protein
LASSARLFGRGLGVRSTGSGKWRPALLGLVGALCAASGAQAVEFGRAVIGETVRDRPQPEYDPVGIRAGSFMLFPSLRAGVQYNDNIFAEPAGRTADAVFGLRPQMLARSLWQRHSLTARVEGHFGIHAENGSEDFEDAEADLRGRIDIAEGSRLLAGINAARAHESRDSPDDARGATPTVFYRIAPELRFEQRVNRVSFRLGAALEALDFQDVAGAGGATINEDDRDRVQWRVEGRVGWDVNTGVQAFVGGLYDRRDYDLALDDNGFNRDSQGYGVHGGVIVEVTGTVSAEAYLGYRRQSYDDPALPDIGGVAGGLNVIWAPTKLTTVTLTGERTVEEATQRGGSGYLSSVLSATVDHELRRNVVISLSGRYQHRRYEGIDRRDDVWRAGASVDYLMSRQFRLRAGYTHVTRDSTLPAEGFESNMIYVNLHADY